MIRVILLFVLLFVLFWAIISIARKMSGREALALTRIVGYSIICSSLALLAMVGLVILF